MSKKVTVTKLLVRGKRFWQVRWTDNEGKLRRTLLKGKAAADAHAAQLRGETLAVDSKLQTVPMDDRERMLFVWQEAKRRGIDLMALLQSPQAPTGSPALADALAEMVQVKTKAGRAGRYLDQLQFAVGQFAKGRERMPMSQVTFREVEGFLNAHGIRSRSTLRSRLSTLFKFAVRRGYRVDNPCDRLEAVRAPHVPPATLTLAETKACLKWLKAHPRSLAWFILSTFAGLRPEEAEQTHWSQINFTEGWIHVEAQTSKIRQRRVVYPQPMVLTWLQKAKRLKSELPLTARARKLDRKALCAVLGWPVWKKDVTRHTAASMWLATEGSAAKVATALGHSESVLRKNYLALVTQEQARAFWALLPETVK